MHLTRLIAFLLGIWLAGSGAMYVVATQNLRSADRILDAPPPVAREITEQLGRDESRMLLRYQAAEQNRWYFRSWERTQLALGVLLLLVILLAVTGKKHLAPLTFFMLILVMVQHWAITPEVIRLGEQIDFLPPSEPSAERTRFWSFHHAYSGLEVLKLGIGFLVFAKLLSKSTRKSHKRDRVDHSDHSHVNR
jgi:hypothetical protein